MPDCAGHGGFTLQVFAWGGTPGVQERFSSSGVFLIKLAGLGSMNYFNSGLLQSAPHTWVCLG